MYLVKTPRFIQRLFPNYTWKVPTSEKVLYITFDDGPIPQVTPWVLDQLKTYNAKATFFCVGENVQKHRAIFEEVIANGHSVGNHTFNHLNGWGTDNIPYFHNVRRCAQLVKSELFRPPYGRLMPKQTQFLQRHYRIIMWDILSGDFDENLSKEQCLSNVMDHVENGSVIVFHDSLKAKDKLEFVLPQVLAYYAQQGYSFEALNESALSQEIRKSA
ncbi:polysaccharide deacetylase family protein [Saprospiraceae bacterium]|jgi:peptidoglycan/xylan/chitin deacetylase (PgdA/CDA1 family)|nr:polysaccharide deacetylase family protein [Bacteroidota bacterium]MDB4727339.1 polysaccharide deacetylase family protein [Saprospiraceae bacterium]MDF1864003.1 polysaccharide deacetylase family protein [Saprospiraceae bacterium]